MSLFTIFIIVVNAVTFFCALSIIIQWHRDTKGKWIATSIGRSLMSLIFVTALVTGTGAAFRLFPNYELVRISYAVGTLMFFVAVVAFGRSRMKIQKEQSRIERRKKRERNG